jgi:hypothetical protein
MRLRITQPLTGSIDGIQLERFVPGCLYVAGTSLGSYLLAVGAAEPVNDQSPALITPLGEQLARAPAALKSETTFPRLLDRVAERVRRRKKPADA